MKTEKVVDHIVQWLKDYAQKAKVKGFVIGISGGIDSAVVSILCAKTGLETLCIEMPIHQADSHVNRAKEHLEFLKKTVSNIKETRVDLTSVFEVFKSEVSLDAQEDLVNMALANTRARLRMTTLYYYAGLHGLLVAGTGNKIEDFGVGFFTKYGDGGVDLSPIADLMKSEVYELAEFLNVPKSIINATPSDGLFGDSRSDEDQIGASYPELEWAMNMKAEGKKADNYEGRQHEVFEIFTTYNRNNQHKMQAIPICQIPKKLK